MDQIVKPYWDFTITICSMLSDQFFSIGKAARIENSRGKPVQSCFINFGKMEKLGGVDEDSSERERLEALEEQMTEMLTETLGIRNRKMMTHVFGDYDVAKATEKTRIINWFHPRWKSEKEVIQDDDQDLNDEDIGKGIATIF